MKHVLYLAMIVALCSCVARPTSTTTADTGMPGERLPAEAGLPNTHAHLFRSAKAERTFLIQVALPYRTNETPLPVIYVLDGNWMFGIAADAARMLSLSGEIPPALIVGIGYDADSVEAIGLMRTRDMTPSVDRRYQPDAAGGAPELLAFMRDELQPFINTIYPVDPSDATLVGVSFGGLFTLYAMFEQHESFRRYVAGSPPLWWDDESMFDREAEFTTHIDDLPVRLFLSVGSLEQLDDPISRSLAMVANVERMTGQIERSNYPGLALETVIFAGETRASVVPATISRGLRWAFADRAP